MLYQLPGDCTAGTSAPQWPEGVGRISARLPDGSRTGIPVLPHTSCLVIGKTGCGKTVFTQKQASGLLEADPELLACFFQIKAGDFTDRFLAPGDRIICHGSALLPQAQVFRWNLVKELRQSFDPEAELRRMGDSFFSHLLEDSRNRLWAGAARDTFLAYLRVVLGRTRDNPSNGRIVQSLRSSGTKELLQFLAQEPRNYSLLRKSFDFDPMHPQAPYQAPRKAEDILFFLNDVLEMFSGNFALTEGTDTIHDFLHGKAGRHLFLQHEFANEAAGQCFERYFLRKCIEDKMSPSEQVKRPLLMVLDEADKIGGDFGAATAATLGRGCGLSVVLSTQSIESLYALCPEKNREHATHAMLAGFPVVAAFEPGDPQTISDLQRLFGSRRQLVTTLSGSRYEPPVVRFEMEPIVSDADFASLGCGEAYLKIRNCPPQKVAIVAETEEF